MKPKKYTKVRTIRFTAAEDELILKKFGARKWSVAARACLLEKIHELPPAVRARRKMSEADAKIALGLLAVGNNLNQLARSVNVAVVQGEQIEVLGALLSILRHVEGLEGGAS